MDFSRRFPLRHELTAGSKICDPVPAKFKHVTNIVTCMLLCCDYVTYVPALKFPKSRLWTLGYWQKIHHFSFPTNGHSLQIFVPRHTYVFSFTHNASGLLPFRCVHPKINENFSIFTFYESKQMSLTQDLRWSLGRSIALLQRQLIVTFVL